LKKTSDALIFRIQWRPSRFLLLHEISTARLVASNRMMLQQSQLCSIDTALSRPVLLPAGEMKINHPDHYTCFLKLWQRASSEQLRADERVFPALMKLQSEESSHSGEISSPVYYIEKLGYRFEYDLIFSLLVLEAPDPSEMCRT